MRAVVVVGALVACGGKPPPPPAPADTPHVATRVPVEDTEPDDNVSVVAKRGHIEETTIQAALAPHTDEMTACFTSRVGKRRWLAGHVVLKWELSADGDIASVKLVDNDLGEHEVEKCLVDIARSASFGKPIGGPTDFTVPMDFGMASGKTKVDVWDEDKGLAAVGAKQLAKLDACSKKGEAMPDDITVTVYVLRGVPQSIGFASAKTEITEKWGDCAVKAALAWKLPVGKDDRGQIAKLAVRYRP
jgi:hypothetical protein